MIDEPVTDQPVTDQPGITEPTTDADSDATKDADPKRIAITWDRGGQAILLETDGARVSVESDAAAAPGTPLAGKFTGGPLGGRPLLIKVRGCRRVNQEPTRYQIDGRFVNLSSKERASLLAALDG